MIYFIDFEATQFSGEIISMGCVDMNGRQFYSLVRPAALSEMTDFIVELTGIHPEELAAAPTADKVFARFLEWLRHDEVAVFYSYGDSDAHFLDRTLPHLSSFRAQLGLSIIRSALRDYAAEIGLAEELSSCEEVKSVTGLASVEIADGLRLGDFVSSKDFASLAGVDETTADALFAYYAAEKGDHHAAEGDLASYRAPLVDLFLFLHDRLEAGDVELTGEQAELVDSLYGQLSLLRVQLQSDLATRCGPSSYYGVADYFCGLEPQGRTLQIWQSLAKKRVWWDEEDEYQTLFGGFFGEAATPWSRARYDRELCQACRGRGFARRMVATAAEGDSAAGEAPQLLHAYRGREDMMPASTVGGVPAGAGLVHFTLCRPR